LEKNRRKAAVALCRNEVAVVAANVGAYIVLSADVVLVNVSETLLVVETEVETEVETREGPS